MTGPARTTIVDVAREAGVSVSTVSKVINNRYGVSPATHTKVMAVVEQLGYETSLIASSLRLSSTHMIGILVPGFEPFSTELLKGISAAAAGTGYELLAYSGATEPHAPGWERRSLSRLGGTLIDGAVIVTPTEELTATSIPVVAIDPHTGKAGPSTVASDNVAGARAATQHLIDLGHTRIGHIGGRQDLESARLRDQGYREALAAAGLDQGPDLVRVGTYRVEDTTIAARELLTIDQPPTAIFAANDLSAIAVLQVAADLGLRVPEDLSVVGFDNVPEAITAIPALTTVAQPMQQMGAEALRLLIGLISGDATEQHLQLAAELIIRDSTAPPSR